jgi:hypothetical protein
MAEVIGTVAAVVQLVTTLNLLGQLCKDAQDVRRAIEDARGDLTRLSEHLELLIPHAMHNNDDARLLAACISNCAKRATRVRGLIDRMERCIERAPPIGRLYTVFMSNELKKLLDELNRAKEEMRDAFTTYRYNRSIPVRIRGIWETWGLRLRIRNHVAKESMFSDIYAHGFLTSIA